VYFLGRRPRPLELLSLAESAIGETEDDGEADASDERQPVSSQIRRAEAENIDDVVQGLSLFRGRAENATILPLFPIFLLEINLLVGMERTRTHLPRVSPCRTLNLLALPFS
jgi:hypothetical protein